MAKKPRKPKSSPAAEAEAAAPKVMATGADIEKMIPSGPLKSYLTLFRKTKKDMADLSGTIGQKTADIVTRYGTNRKALAIVRSLAPLENEKLADVLDHLEYLLDAGGLRERADKVMRLALGDQPGDQDAEDAAEDGEAAEAKTSGNGKVTPFRQLAASASE